MEVNGNPLGPKTAITEIASLLDDNELEIVTSQDICIQNCLPTYSGACLTNTDMPQDERTQNAKLTLPP